MTLLIVAQCPDCDRIIRTTRTDLTGRSRTRSRSVALVDGLVDVAADAETWLAEGWEVAWHPEPRNTHVEGHAPWCQRYQPTAYGPSVEDALEVVA